MKHREKTPAKEPRQIGQETITLVERELRAVGFEIPATLPAPLKEFAAALALWGNATNLTAAPDDPAELAFHLLDSLAPLVLAERSEHSGLRGLFAPDRRVLDLGSGAGFPGLVLAAATEAHFTLLEARRKRASFLTVAATEMRLTNIEVDSRHRSPEHLLAVFDVVTGRAFAQPGVFHRSAGRSLGPGGAAILYANPEQNLDLGSAGAAGFGVPELLRYDVPRGTHRVSRLLVILRKL